MLEDTTAESYLAAWLPPDGSPKNVRDQPMSDIGKRIAELLLSTQSIQVYRERPFVFVSGRVSPVYIDCRRVLSFPDARDEILEALAQIARRDIGLDKIDVVAGGETAGIPYAAFVSHYLRKPMIYIRKNPKGYG